MNELLLKSVKRLKRILVIVTGFTLLLVGIAMLVLPGPAIIVIPLGLALLSTEFAWARRLMKEIKKKIRASMPANETGTKTKEEKDP
jgi:uncharacterized protein (TIGR02611 family)